MSSPETAGRPTITGAGVMWKNRLRTFPRLPGSRRVPPATALLRPRQPPTAGRPRTRLKRKVPRTTARQRPPSNRRRVPTIGPVKAPSNGLRRRAAVPAALPPRKYRACKGSPKIDSGGRRKARSFNPSAAAEGEVRAAVAGVAAAVEVVAVEAAGDKTNACLRNFPLRGR